MVACEILEHLERPVAALRSLRRTLHAHGRLFATVAVNLAQEDHIALFRTAAEGRALLEEAGLSVEREWLAPMAVTAFEEADRSRIFRKGNYIAVARA